MNRRPKFDLVVLRRIGFEQWNPIGAGVPKDEYDTYLLRAFGKLWNEDAVERVAEYLVEVEVDCMGLQSVPGIRARAHRVAIAIRDYVDTQRMGPS